MGRKNGMTSSKVAERRKGIIRDAESGMTVKELVAKYGISMSFVYETLKGVSVASDGQNVQVRPFVILKKIMTSPETDAEIARECKVSRQRVHQIRLAAKEAGFDV